MPLKTERACVLIDTATAIHIIWGLNVGPALICGLETILHSHVGRPVDLFALSTQIKTATNHITSKFHVLVDGIIDRLDAVSIVYGELGIVRRLNTFADNTISDA